MWRFCIISLFLFGIVACSSNHYNPTVYSYEFNPDLAKKLNKQVMISPINYDKPSRHYLTEHEEPVDDTVKKYLKNSGYTVIPNKSFKSLWKKSEIEFGSPYNPSTGEMTSGFKPALQSTLQTLFKQNPQLDAVIFTDLIEVPVQYSNASKKIAQWNGVHRKVKVEGVGEDLTDEFNWSHAVDGISIVIHVVNRDQQLVQHSIGGMQIAQSIKLNNKNAKFSRRNDLLAHENEILEGVQLALHPWIIMKDYPQAKP